MDFHEKEGWVWQMENDTNASEATYIVGMLEVTQGLFGLVEPRSLWLDVTQFVTLCL